MIRYKRCAATIALMSGLLMGASASALPLTAGAKDIASTAEHQALTIQAQARRTVRAAPRVRVAPRVIGRRVVRAPRVLRPFVRRRPSVIIGIGPGFYYEPFSYYNPYYYEPYSYEPAYDDAVAYCIRRFRSYDLRTRTYLGYDGRRHPCP